VDGTAFHHRISTPLARPSVLRDLFLGFPSWAHALLTWSALAAAGRVPGEASIERTEQEADCVAGEPGRNDSDDQHDHRGEFGIVGDAGSYDRIVHVDPCRPIGLRKCNTAAIARSGRRRTALADGAPL
jgi:hypothetical protein